MQNQKKHTEYLFLNLACILKNKKQSLTYGSPQYTSAETGFSVTMFRVPMEAYDLAEQCFIALGKEPIRECGVTMSVTFDTAEENDTFREHFQSLIDQAEQKLSKFKGTPREYYFLKTNPVLLGIEDSANNHYVILRADIADDVDREICDAILGDCEITITPDQRAEIKVACYRKKWRDQLVHYLRSLGVQEA